MRFLIYDLKRMFSGKKLVALCLISPIIVVLLFSTIVSPMLFTAKGLHFNLALCDEDKSEEVNQFINQLINSQAMADLVSVYPVATVEEGTKLVESGDVSVLVHVPDGLFANIRSGQEVKAKVISTKAHSMEAELILMTLNSSLSLVGQSQNIMQAAQYILLEKGTAEAEATTFLKDKTGYAISEYMSRREVLGAGGPLSPMGEYLPVEYYISAIFSLFAALAMLPLIHFSAVDASGAILRRGLLCGMGTGRFFAARIVSGSIFILLVQLMLLPTSFLLRLAGDMLGGSYANNLAALAIALLLSSLCYSALALTIATWLPDQKTALWTGFFLVLGMAVVCGALIPEGALPQWASLFGRWLPLRASMRTLSLALFNYDQAIFCRDIGKTISFAAVLLILGFLGLKRRGHGR